MTTTELFTTKTLRESAERDGSPEMQMAMLSVEILVNLIMDGKLQECEKLTDAICKNPHFGHVTIAAAIGVIANAELAHRAAKKTLTGLLDNSPDTLDALKRKIADEHGLAPEKFEKMSQQVDEAIRKGE